MVSCSNILVVATSSTNAECQQNKNVTKYDV